MLALHGFTWGFIELNSFKEIFNFQTYAPGFGLINEIRSLLNYYTLQYKYNFAGFKACIMQVPKE